jgi:solute carrier family 25 (mitochondrial carnitine/acylcarnitine transporter), member 20/29
VNGGVTPATNERLTTKQYFAAGMLTGAGIAFVETPMDLFKSQIQVQVFKKNPQFTSVSQAVKYIAKTGGIRGVYQGLGPTILRNTPAVSLYFGVYEWTRSKLTPKGGSVNDLGAASTLAAGALGGFAYWGTTYPMDAIKSAMQGDAPERPKRKYKSVIDCAKQMYKQGGIKRFYAGYAPCVIRSVPANAVCFLAYELTVKALNKV